MVGLIIYGLLGLSMLVASIGKVIEETEKNVKALAGRLALLVLASVFWPVTVVIVLLRLKKEEQE